MRAALKRLAERFLLVGGPAALARASLRHRTLILAYHNILPDGAKPGRDRSLHLPRRAFSEQLDMLQETCTVVPLDEVLSRPPEARPRVAITFDDAYHGAVSAGQAELLRRGLPATFFVAPGYVGGRSFWWDVLVVPGSDTLPEAVRAHLLDACAGKEDKVRDWARLQGWQLDEPEFSARCSSEQDLLGGVGNGIAVGSHTWSHPNLAKLESSELETELRRSLEWLKERFTPAQDWVSYPYGLGSAAVESAARFVGYEAGLMVTGGWMEERTTNHYAIPRFNVPAGISLDGFRLRLAGLFAR